jgi:hypothetical protein
MDAIIEIIVRLFHSFTPKRKRKVKALSKHAEKSDDKK